MATPADARLDPALSSRAGALASRVLGQIETGSGGFSDSEFQSSASLEFGRQTDGHDSYRFRRLFTAFLDRTARSVSDLRHRSSSAAGERARISEGAYFSDQRNDSAAELLRAGYGQP